MSNKNIDGSGTIRCNRINNNNSFAYIDLKDRKSGDCECRESEENHISTVQWKNIVTMCYNASGAKPIHNVKSYYIQGDQKTIQIEQKYVVKKCNANMGRVDRCDENISLYITSIRGEKC